MQKFLMNQQARSNNDCTIEVAKLLFDVNSRFYGEKEERERCREKKQLEIK